jgi:hypothetical protein
MPRSFVLVALLSVYGLSSLAVSGQEPPKPDPLELNAALVYWQAFALMPALSEAEAKIRDDVNAGTRAMDDEARKIVQKSGEAMQYLHRAAKFEKAAWGIPWEEGPYAILPHISKARELTRLAELRARARFADGEDAKAIEDLLAAIRMGRQVGREGVIVLIPLLVDHAIEAMCIHTLAEHLPKLDAQTRAVLKKRLAALPKSRTLVDAMQGEKDVFWPWMIAEIQKPDPKAKMLELVNGVKEEELLAFKKLDEKELGPAVERMGGYYDRMIAMAKLPLDEMKEKDKELMAELKRNGPKDYLAYWLMPGLSGARQAEVRHLSRMALFDAGLAVLEQGEQALKDPKHKDPYGDGPFDYRDTDNGFVLTSDWEIAPGKKLSLTFGK